MNKTSSDQTGVERSRSIAWRLVLVTIGLLGVLLVLRAWQLPPFRDSVVRTEDAYVRGQITVISPQVAGYVTAVLVQDYQQVRQGQLLATIDDRIYRQRLEQARADLHAAKVALANSAQTQAIARGGVAQQRASIAGATAQLERAKADAARVDPLLREGWVTRAEADAAQAAVGTAQASLAQAQAQESIAVNGVTSAQINKGSLEAAVENAQAKVRLAKIDLANTHITAPRPGRLSDVSVRQGQQVAVGTQLMSIVPQQVWVVANLKETQLHNVRVGERATVSVDALGGARFTGRVERISPATGSEFSVIRSDNASGNFIKIPQRVPVRIGFDTGQPRLDQLLPGLSVVAKIETH